MGLLRSLTVLDFFMNAVGNNQVDQIREAVDKNCKKVFKAEDICVGRRVRLTNKLPDKYIFTARYIFARFTCQNTKIMFILPTSLNLCFYRNARGMGLGSCLLKQSMELSRSEGCDYYFACLTGMYLCQMLDISWTLV
jgi:hypothetical protein